MRRAIIALCVLAAVLECAAGDQWRNMLMARHRAAAGTDVGFRVTFLTGTTPTNIVLHASYTGPATAAAALYDAGDGVWRAYTANTISNVTGYVAFKGNWLNAAGGYQGMFYSTFAAAYTCKFSGALETTPTAFSSCYRDIFRDCTAVTAIEDNPLPILTGTPAADMFRNACFGMSGVTGALPAGFMDTSGLTGTPATGMFQDACANMSGVNALSTGFLDTSGLTGTPATNMLAYSCYGMSSVTGGDIAIGANITLTSANVVGPLTSMMQNMPNWTGNVYWGAQPLTDQIANPDSDTNAFAGNVLMPGYADMGANWK